MNSQIPLPISISIFSIFQSSQIAPKLQPIACEAQNKTNIKTHALLFTIRISKLLVICVAVTSPRRRWVGLSATFTRKQTLLSLTQTSFLNLKKRRVTQFILNQFQVIKSGDNDRGETNFCMYRATYMSHHNTIHIPCNGKLLHFFNLEQSGLNVSLI